MSHDTGRGRHDHDDLTVAAVGGDPEAMHALHLLCLREADYRGAVRWLHRAVEAGHAPSMHALGEIAEATGVIDGDTGARAWFRAAADRGHPPSAEALRRLPPTSGS